MSNYRERGSTSANSASDNRETHTTWILGKSYVTKDHLILKSRAKSFFKFTYRRDFPAMIPYAITTDSGWGCMIRVAQMMMAEILKRVHLGSFSFLTCNNLPVALQTY